MVFSVTLFNLNPATEESVTWHPVLSKWDMQTSHILPVTRQIYTWQRSGAFIWLHVGDDQARRTMLYAHAQDMQRRLKDGCKHDRGNGILSVCIWVARRRRQLGLILLSMLWTHLQSLELRRLLFKYTLHASSWYSFYHVVISARRGVFHGITPARFMLQVKRRFHLPTSQEIKLSLQIPG